MATEIDYPFDVEYQVEYGLKGQGLKKTVIWGRSAEEAEERFREWAKDNGGFDIIYSVVEL